MAAITNAQAALQVQDEFGSFAAYVWSFTNGEQLVNAPTNEADIPTQTELSATVAKDMKKRGFRFVGPVIVYNFLQAVGVIDDHIVAAH
jgi:DNA-3-methyladenine glycosylase I